MDGEWHSFESVDNFPAQRNYNSNQVKSRPNQYRSPGKQFGAPRMIPPSGFGFGSNRPQFTPHTDNQQIRNQYNQHEPRFQFNSDYRSHEPRFQPKSNHSIRPQRGPSYSTGPSGWNQSPRVRPNCRSSFPSNLPESSNYSSSVSNNTPLRGNINSRNASHQLNSLFDELHQQMALIASPDANNFPCGYEDDFPPCDDSSWNQPGKDAPSITGTQLSNKAKRFGRSKHAQALFRSQYHKKTVEAKQSLPDLKWKSGTGPVVDIRLLISGRQVGALLGKLGLNFKRLKSEYCESIMLNSGQKGNDQAPHLPEATFSMSSKVGTVSEALLDIIPRLKSLDDKSADSELRLILHESQIGWVVGQDGELIADLCESADTTVYVFPEPCPLSTDRVVSVHGLPVKVIDCVADILVNLVSYPPVGSVRNYDIQNCCDHSHVEYGGYSTESGPVVQPVVPRIRKGVVLDGNEDIRFTNMNTRRLRVSVVNEYFTNVFGEFLSYGRQLHRDYQLKVIQESPSLNTRVQEVTLIGHPEQLVRAQGVLHRRYMRAQHMKTMGHEGPYTRKRQRPEGEWITDELRAMTVQKRKLERVYLNARNSGDEEKIEETYRIYRKQLKACGNAYTKAKHEWEEAHGITNEKREKKKAQKLAYEALKAARAQAEQSGETLRSTEVCADKTAESAATNTEPAALQSEADNTAESTSAKETEAQSATGMERDVASDDSDLVCLDSWGEEDRSI